jgi:class III poly(R)-hydroxyalkanoic acid synthase PhaE subunit
MQPLKSLTSQQQQIPVREQLNKFLSIPGVGYSREHQEQYQKLMQLYMDYQTAFEVYSAEFAKIGGASVERFQSKVMEAVGSDQPIDSMRSLFNLWVDACEEAYADQVSSDEYAKVYGRLVNSLMAFKKQGQALADETLGLMSMPTREDISTLQQRYQTMRRELRDIHARMDQLERQPPVAVARTSASPAPRKKTVGAAQRKKVTAKRTAVRATRATRTSREDKS